MRSDEYDGDWPDDVDSEIRMMAKDEEENEYMNELFDDDLLDDKDDD